MTTKYTKNRYFWQKSLKKIIFKQYFWTCQPQKNAHVVGNKCTFKEKIIKIKFPNFYSQIYKILSFYQAQTLWMCSEKGNDLLIVYLNE